MKLFMFLFILLIFSCTKKEENAKLVVFISIDQWGYDLLKKYQAEYKGGFKRIWDEANVYSNALHNFSSTETGPGHSVLLTGNYPSQTGIVRNHFTDRTLGKDLYCVQDDSAKLVGTEKGMGISPKNLLVPTIGDILKKETAARVFSIAGKDRSAVLMAGHKADGVYWYHSKTGKIISSDFYINDLPDYIKEINSEKYFDKFFNDSWKKKFDIDYEVLSRKDKFLGEADNIKTTFPHKLNTNAAKEVDTKFYSTMRYTPFLDQYILRTAETILEKEKLGKSKSTDMLIVGLSATDYIGHKFGPYSQEMLDHLLRLDNYLESFFTSLDEYLGKDNYLVVMSADHGVAPVPEYSAMQGNDAKRISRDQLKSDILKIKRKFKLNKKFDLDNIIEDKTFPKEKRELILKELRGLPYIEDLFTLTELSNPNTEDRPYLSDYKKSFHPDRSDAIEYLPKKYYLVPAYYVGGTSHGSAHFYDKHVPIIFMGKGFKKEKIEKQVETIDIAPSLHKILNLKEGSFQGKSLY